MAIYAALALAATHLFFSHYYHSSLRIVNDTKFHKAEKSTVLMNHLKEEDTASPINPGAIISLRSYYYNITSTTSPISENTVISNDTACIFPEQDPFHASIMAHHSQFPKEECLSGLPSLVYLDSNMLTINQTKALLKNVTLDYCQYSTLKLITDFQIQRSAWSSPFKIPTLIGKEMENICVKCFYKDKLVSKSYLSRIVKKKSVEKSCKFKYRRHMFEKSPKETLSVLIIGVDSISRQQMIRSMPKTRQFIIDHMNAMELFKFNKNGYNTFPNVIPLLTGLTEDEFKKRWQPDEPFDAVDYLMLWSRFKEEAGYRTGVMFDTPELTAFHYGSKGWERPTFDYYRRPMIMDIFEDARPKESCVGDTPETTYLLDYWLQLCKVFNNTKTTPYFAYSFISRQSHDYPNHVTAVDHYYLEFFQKLQRDRLLNNTVILFFSDHGARFGVMRLNHYGLLESRTPFVFFMFPDWFHKKYPHLMKAFRTNQHRLTSFFDIHATFLDLLNFQGKSGKGYLSSRGISLFKEIPPERMCHNAGIPLLYCMCSSFKEENQSLSSLLKKTLSDEYVRYIVSKTEDYRGQCAVLSLVRVRSVVEITNGIKSCETCKYFFMTIEMSPGESIFEALLEHSEAANMTRLVGDAQRLTRYSGQAECMNNINLRPFCYCKRLRRRSMFVRKT